MGRVNVDDIVASLQSAGILTERSFPARSMANVTEPVAAVSLLSASLKGQTMTVQVTVLSPAEMGGAACEEKALEAGTVLSGIGGDCTVGECAFDGRAGLFMVPVKAQFLTEIPKVKINDILLQHVEAFTSWRAIDEELGITSILDAPWNFRLEEFFPTGVDEDSDCSEPFELMHISCSGTEDYLGCQWTYQKRTWDSTGIRQIRLGTAELMDNG